MTFRIRTSLREIEESPKRPMGVTLTDAGSRGKSESKHEIGLWILARLLKNTKETSIIDNVAEGSWTISYQF